MSMVSQHNNIAFLTHFVILSVLKSTPARGGLRREIVADEDDEESKKVIASQLFVT